jgi:hypothetical protein
VEGQVVKRRLCKVEWLGVMMGMGAGQEVRMGWRMVGVRAGQEVKNEMEDGGREGGTGSEDGMEDGGHGAGQEVRM